MRYRALMLTKGFLLACSLMSAVILNCLPRVQAAHPAARALSRRPTTRVLPTQDSRVKTPDSETGAFKLTIDNIMRGSGLVGYEPRAVRWSPDSQRIYFEWKQASDPAEKDFDTYVVSRDGTGLLKLSEDEAQEAPPAGGEMTLDKKMTVVARRGDIWVYDNSKSEMHRITSTSDIESNPHFTRDGRSVYFTRSNNLYVMRLGSGELAELTDIRTPGSAPESGPGARGPAAARGTGAESQSGQDRQLTDSQQYMKKEEEELFDAIKERVRRRKDEEALQKRLNPRKPFMLRQNQTIAALQLSPDQKYVIAQVVDQGAGARSTAVPEYVTESGYTENIPGRTNVGDAQPRTRIAILDSRSGEVKWLDHGIKAPPPPRPPAAKPDEKPDAVESRPASEGDGAAPDPTGEAAAAPGRQEDLRNGRGGAKSAQPVEREIRLSEPVWSEDGSKAVLLGRAADNKDRWIFALEPATGKARVVATDHDDAWVDGPGAQTLGWMPDGQHVYFQSERDGYSHLYTADYATGEVKQLTSGKWEVTGVQLSNDKSRFLLTTSETSPGDRQVYWMAAAGGERTALSAKPGNHQAVLSPDEKWLAVIYSYSNKPPELYVQENRPGAVARQLTKSPSAEFGKYNWIDPPIVSFSARDGARVYARLYKPAGFKRGGPAVIFVHGAGYLQKRPSLVGGRLLSRVHVSSFSDGARIHGT